MSKVKLYISTGPSHTFQLNPFGHVTTDDKHKNAQTVSADGNRKEKPTLTARLKILTEAIISFLFLF